MRKIILALVITLSQGYTPFSFALPAKPKNISPTVGLKNYRELFAALASATKVDPNQPDVVAYYSQVKAQLPRTGTLVEFNSQSLVASIGLASVFCKRVIFQDSELNGPKSGLNQGIDFLKPVSHVTDTQLNNLIKNYSQAFLQRDATPTEQKTLSNLFRAEGTSNGGPGETRAAVLSVCTSLAGSFEFLSN